VILSPALYLSWLILFLALSAAICRRMGSRYPKPRYLVVRPGAGRITRVELGLVAASGLYRRLAIVHQLPLVNALRLIRGFATLTLRAYSPSVHVGEGVLNFGVLWDPDLTYIEDHVVIGGNATILAHGVTARPDGATVYVSAPVTIGPRATIGGQALVTMGCTIGADAVIEPGAVVPPFSSVPAGEVWGGNPARLLRRRDDLAAAPRPSGETGSEPAVAAPLAPAAVPSSSGRVAAAAPSIDQIRHLVVDALQIGAGDTGAEPSASTCAEWDSLGQVAIAAALFDRFGIAVPPERVFALRTLADIVDAVGRGEAAAPPVEALPDDVEMLPLMDSQEATRRLAARFEGLPSTGPRLHVVIAATFTAQPLASAVRLWGRAFGLELECQFASYDQTAQALLDPAGPFATNPGGVNVVLARPEDLLSSPETATARLDQLLDALESFASDPRSGADLLVGSLPPVVSSSAILPPAGVEAARSRWRDRVAALSSVDVLDFAGVVARLGTERARSSSSEAVTRGPYSPRLYQDLGIALVRRIRAARRHPVKVIAVDCDDTLWGGVLGEVQVEGLALGPDGPGRAFQLLQRQIKDLKEKGLLIVVVSRNDEGDVRQVFERHPGMVLRTDDVTAWRVNWKYKSENLRDLAESLGLGLDTFVLLDDDPAVRAEVATRLPEVHVVPLDGDPSARGDALARLWLFDDAHRTAIDASRTRMMQEEGRRAQERRRAATLEEYLADLQLAVEVGPPGDEEWPRIAQLTQRTNQFNLSLRRRTLSELRSLPQDTCLLALKARDRFGDYGLVGAAILRPAPPSEGWALDTFLISCRALGRGVDDAFLHGVAQVAATRGARALVAAYVEGPRNGQVREFLARGGFTETTLHTWHRPLASLPGLPSHVRFELSDGAGESR
jgi:FkbH-like protein